MIGHLTSYESVDMYDFGSQMLVLSLAGGGRSAADDCKSASKASGLAIHGLLDGDEEGRDAGECQMGGRRKDGRGHGLPSQQPLPFGGEGTLFGVARLVLGLQLPLGFVQLLHLLGSSKPNGSGVLLLA